MTEPKFSFRDPNGRGRYYKAGDRSAVPSITNIKKRQNNPAINGSVVRKVAEFAVDNYERLNALSRDEKLRVIKGTQYEKSEASVVGDIVHDWIDRYVKGNPPANKEVKEAIITAQRMWERFLAFTKDALYRPEFLMSEFTVWSDKYGYAGTGDLGMKVGPERTFVLCDTKTGTGIWPDTAMQLAALKNADFMLDSEGNEVPMPPFEKCAVLHLRPKSYALNPYDKIEEAFETFLALKRVFDWELNDAPVTIVDAPKHN